jgi:hypothetical protein
MIPPSYPILQMNKLRLGEVSLTTSPLGAGDVCLNSKAGEMEQSLGIGLPFGKMKRFWSYMVGMVT